MSKPTHLKSIKSGRVFIYDEILASRPDMVACDAQGNITEGHIGDVDTVTGNERRRTKYLGSLSNGGLYPYTEVLAQRADMVSVDSPEEWEAHLAEHRAGEQIRPPEKPEQKQTEAPVLKREAPDQQQQPEGGEQAPQAAGDDGQAAAAAVPNAAQDPGFLSLPDITGLGAREAKSVLAEWAAQNFNESLDRRMKLEDLIRECQALLENFGDQSALPAAVGLE